MSRPAAVPEIRVRRLNERPPRPAGKYVLYWMVAARRTRWNFALDRAVELAAELKRPLIVLEAIRAGYPWASDRLHRFVIDGMADNARRFEGRGVLYHPYVEPRPGKGTGLLKALAAEACVVVTDDYPAFFLPRMIAAAATRLPVRAEAVDSNGILPMRAAPVLFHRAFDFRRFLQRELRPFLSEAPRPDPLRTALPSRKRLPEGISGRWPAASGKLLSGDAAALSALPIDHGVPPVAGRGGETAGRRVMARFVTQGLDAYETDRNVVEKEGTSGLSPYLHFGHVSAHEILREITSREEWTIDRLSRSTAGKRSGWWGLSAAAEAFLDQLVTWRELGFNYCSRRDDYDQYESLPIWARKSLKEHEGDRRPHIYTPEQFEEAATHDDIWNAAQNQLREEGRIHNYLRMLWGKKILHWSGNARSALEIMIHLNNKYALDGRDPNSYSGIFWTLGRYDRPWGPERPVFGKIRYMSSANTKRKLKLGRYIERFNGQPSLALGR